MVLAALPIVSAKRAPTMKLSNDGNPVSLQPPGAATTGLRFTTSSEPELSHRPGTYKFVRHWNFAVREGLICRTVLSGKCPEIRKVQKASVRRIPDPFTLHSHNIAAAHFELQLDVWCTLY